MRRAAPWIKLLLAGALAAGIVWLLFPSPVRVIRNNLEGLAAAASSSPSGNIKRLANVNTLLGYFAQEVVINLEGYGRAAERISGRDELTQLLMAGRTMGQSFKVEFYDIQVALEEGGLAATARLAALVTQQGQTDPLVQEFYVRFVKTGRSWLISEVRPVNSSAVGR